MTDSQPSPAAGIDQPLTPSILGALAGAAPALRAAAPRRVRRTTGYCSELLQLEIDDGEPLIVKRARFDWVAPRLRASRLAAALLRRRTGVLAPGHLEVEADARGRAMEAYRRIPLPTLGELWPGLPERRRPQALRSWGTLLRRVHRIELAAHGPLEGVARPRRARGGLASPATLADVLRADLSERLAPALAGVWPEAQALALRLVAHVDEVDARCAGRRVVLLHNDFHMGNVLCERRPRSVRCVGVIDLETAWAGPQEADVARVQVLHGKAFGSPLADGWGAHFLDGYGDALDPFVLACFRALDRLNLGYFAAVSGWWEHARALGRELAAELDALPRARRRAA